MPLFAFQHFRRDVVWSSADCSFSLSVELQFSGETEITNLDLHLVVQEQVTELQISVNDTVAVQVFNSGADLINVALDFKFVQSLPSPKQLIQRLVLTEFKEDVHVLCVLEEMLESDNVVVMERSMDLDLGHELLLGTSLGERRLLNDFCSRNSLVLQVRELKASGEATLSEELALQIALDADLAVVLDDLLFDDCLGILHALLGIALCRWILSHC